LKKSGFNTTKRVVYQNDGLKESEWLRNNRIAREKLLKNKSAA